MGGSRGGEERDQPVGLDLYGSDVGGGYPYLFPDVRFLYAAVSFCFVHQIHDTHHPVAIDKYYEDQLSQAKDRTASFRSLRLPKFFAHFQNVLATNTEKHKNGGTYLIGSTTTTADLALFQVCSTITPSTFARLIKGFVEQVVDGLLFAFPKRVAALKATGDYDNVFELYERVKNEKGIKEYIASGRRQKYANGIWRHYEELDGDE